METHDACCTLSQTVLDRTVVFMQINGLSKVRMH